ncbi:MAG: hypothetical protein WCG81_12890 [Candidatus Angelobacter sp.]
MTELPEELRIVMDAPATFATFERSTFIGAVGVLTATLLLNSWAGDINDKQMITITKTKSCLLMRVTMLPHKIELSVRFNPKTCDSLGETRRIYKRPAEMGVFPANDLD